MSHDPFAKVAASLNRDLAFLAGGLIVAGGIVATAVYAFIDSLLHRHQSR